MRISDWSSDVCSSDLAIMATFVSLARQDPRPDMLSFMGDLAIAKELYVLAALIAMFGVVQLVAALLRSRALDRNGFMEVVSDLFAMPDRQSVVEGKSVVGRVDTVCRRKSKNKN